MERGKGPVMTSGPMMKKGSEDGLPRPDWKQRWTLPRISFVLFLILLLASLPIFEGSGRDISFWEQLLRFLGQFFPPDFSILPQISHALWETVQIACLATSIGVVFSLVLGLLAARGVSPAPVVAVTRLILNAIRTIPSLIWALLAVAVMGANAMSGVVGLSFYSMGYLAKFFSEAFESLDPEVTKGLQHLGADRIQAFQYGLWPSVRPIVWSHTLWMLEYNIRSASIIGYVGAGGIGLQLLRYQEFGQWDRFATVLICILLIVVFLDTTSSLLRKHLTTSGQRP